MNTRNKARYFILYSIFKHMQLLYLESGCLIFDPSSPERTYTPSTVIAIIFFIGVSEIRLNIKHSLHITDNNLFSSL